MKRIPTALLALLSLALVAAAPASARVIELGQAANSPAPSCIGSANDANCRAITKTTAYPVRAGTVKAPMTVTADGRIVAFTLRVGKPTRKQNKFFKDTYGGTARVRLTTLHYGPKFGVTVTHQSDEVRLEPYFGKTVQIPLGKTLAVKKGDGVAITTTTWAPILAVNQGAEYSWRVSRGRGLCGNDGLATQSALLGAGTKGTFGCFYSTAVPTYSATLITLPKPPPVTKP